MFGLFTIAQRQTKTKPWRYIRPTCACNIAKGVACPCSATGDFHLTRPALRISGPKCDSPILNSSIARQ